MIRDACVLVDGSLVTTARAAGLRSIRRCGSWEPLHGRDHARQVRRYIQYDPAPPYLADEPVCEAQSAASGG